MSATIFAVLPPIIAIALALITKEVYSSLLIGIFAGALLFHGFNPLHATETTFAIMGGKISDNIGILMFLVMLGILVSLVTKSGASRAYGEWASHVIKSRRGALLATSFLGMFIFVDDYFNCLTVGTVMRPVTDKYPAQSSRILLMQPQRRSASLHRFPAGQRLLPPLCQRMRESMALHCF